MILDILIHISKPFNCTKLGMRVIKVPIVKHLNHSVYFIKKKFKGSNSSCESQTLGELELAVSFTLLTIINQVALSISEQLCRQTQEYSTFQCDGLGAVLVKLQPQ